jgi:hypothetical protein
MQTDLRPMTLGEILDRTAQLYRSNFVLFAGIAAVYGGVLLLLNLVQIGLAELLRRLHMTQQLPWVTLGFIVLIVPLIFIFAGAAVAANNRAVAWVNLGQPATIRGAYLSIMPRLGRYLWLMTIIGFLIYIPFVLIFIAYFVFLFVYARPRGIFVHGGANANPQTAIVLLLVTFAFCLLATVAFAYAIFMALRYSLALPASVLEDLEARKAIRRSIELSKGSRGRIFVLGLLISVIQIGLVAVTQVFFIVAAVKQHGQLPVWVQIAQQIVGFFTNSFIGPMYATGLTLFYYDQRVRKEGYDIEWMMEAAGMNRPLLASEAHPVSGSPARASSPDAAEVEPAPQAEVPAPEDSAADAGLPQSSEPASTAGQPQPPPQPPPESPHG